MLVKGKLSSRTHQSVVGYLHSIPIPNVIGVIVIIMRQLIFVRVDVF